MSSLVLWAIVGVVVGTTAQVAYWLGRRAGLNEAYRIACDEAGGSDEPDAMFWRRDGARHVAHRIMEARDGK